MFITAMCVAEVSEAGKREFFQQGAQSIYVVRKARPQIEFIINILVDNVMIGNELLESKTRKLTTSTKFHDVFDRNASDGTNTDLNGQSCLSKSLSMLNVIPKIGVKSAIINQTFVRVTKDFDTCFATPLQKFITSNVLTLVPSKQLFSLIQKNPVFSKFRHRKSPRHDLHVDKGAALIEIKSLIKGEMWFPWGSYFRQGANSRLNTNRMNSEINNPRPFGSGIAIIRHFDHPFNKRENATVSNGKRRRVKVAPPIERNAIQFDKTNDLLQNKPVTTRQTFPRPQIRNNEQNSHSFRSVLTS